jgi:hypothetical protein
MTHEEMTEIIERALARCDHLGALLVGDDETLSRLFAALEIHAEVRGGGYLVS